MKTLKFALIATLVAFTMVSLANADGFKSKPKPIKIVNLAFEKAMTSPGLVLAMYAQLDKDDFLNSLQHIYVAKVSFQGTMYQITGTRTQWVRFFMMQGELPINTKYKGIGIN